eukprot:1875510-Prymnesium_polylepis.1
MSRGAPAPPELGACVIIDPHRPQTASPSAPRPSPLASVVLFAPADEPRPDGSTSSESHLALRRRSARSRCLLLRFSSACSSAASSPRVSPRASPAGSDAGLESRGGDGGVEPA